MAGHQKGRNAGVRGWVDLDGSPAFRAQVYKFSRQEGAAPIVRTARGDQRRRIRQTTPGGTLMVWGRVRKDGYPEPAALKDQTGTITLTYSGAAKQTLAVRCLQATLGYDEKYEDEWRIELVLEVTANPVSEGFGGEQTAAAAAPELNHLELHEGNTKGIDPDEINDSDTYVLDVEGLTDSDAAEVAWVADRIAEYVATRTGMKVRRADFARIDHWGGRLTVTVARTTTAEDLVNAETWTVSDTENVADAAQVAGIDEVTGSGPAGLIYRTTRTRELNDLHNLVVDEYGLRTTAQDLTMPASGSTLDPLAIESQQREALLYPTGNSPPAAPATASAELQLVSAAYQEVNQLTRRVDYGYAVLNSEQRVGFPRVRTTDDAENLDDDAVRYKFFTHGGTAPSAPDDPPANNVKLLHTLDLRVTPEKDVRVFTYGPRSSRDERVLAQTEAGADAAGLRSTQTLAWLDGEDEPADPAAPYVLRFTKTIPLTHGLGVDRTLYVKVYGTTTTAQDVTFPRTETAVAPTYRIEETAMRCKLWDAGGSEPSAPDDAPANNVKLLGYTDVPVTDAKMLRVWAYGPRDARDRAVFDRAYATTDPSGLEGETVVAWLGGIEAAPADPAGLVLRYTRTYTITEGLPIQNATLGVRVFGYRSTQDDVEMPGTFTLAPATQQRLIHTTTVQSSTNTADVDALAIYDTLKDDPTFEQVRAVKLNANKTRIDLVMQGTSFEIEFDSRTHGDLLTPWRLTVGGTVQFYLDDLVQVTDTLWAYRLGVVPTRCTVMDLILWKRIVQPTDLYAYLPSAGYANSDTFLTMSPYTVGYAGSAGRARVNDAYRWDGTNMASVDLFTGPRRQGWRFQYDSRGIVNGANVSPGCWHYTSDDLSGLSAGDWVDAADLGISAGGALLADFSATFLNTTP